MTTAELVLPTCTADPSGGVRLDGSWTLAGFACGLPLLPEKPVPRIDAGGLTALDTAGALQILALEAGSDTHWDGLTAGHATLLDLVRTQAARERPPPPPVPGCLEALGRRATAQLCEVRDFLGFFGEMSLAFWRALLLPHRFRWTPFLANIQSAGLAAMPIVGLLSFLLGVVIAYQGGSQLGRYGANIFIVELVSLTMLREMSVIMTAIIVAGRTGSAWTAQIGTMRVTEEIDALRTIGIRPMDMLVIPKVFALMVALPLLTVYADAMGVLGGMVMADLQLGVSFQEFLQRFPQAVSVRSFLIGVGKAPVFALLIALVGCYQGFKVSGGAEAVGRQTTVSVVQSIFLVIVVDAAFSVLFSWLKI